jgi:two-component system, sensor histidine kinase and response regulator
MMVLLKGDRSLSPSQKEHLDIITRSGEQLLELINDILDLSKIELGRMELNITCFDLHRLLFNLQQTWQLRAESKGLQLIFERSPVVPQYIETDDSRI